MTSPHPAGTTAPPSPLPGSPAETPGSTTEHPAAQPPDRILWDIQREHLDEAAFLFTQWTLALSSPLYTLKRLQQTVEARLLAQVDGLVVGGEPVVSHLILPRLKTGSDGETFAAALALLLDWKPTREKDLLDALTQASGSVRWELIRALQLRLPDSPTGGLEPALRALLGHAKAPARAAALEILCHHGRLSEQEVLAGLQDGDWRVQKAALQALRALGYQALAQQVLSAFMAPPPPEEQEQLLVHRAALEAALVLGHAEGVSRAYHHASTLTARSLPWDEGILLLGARLDRHAIPVLERLTALAPMRSSAILALGLTGQVEAADLCLRLLQDSGVRGVAGEAFALITGLDLSRPELQEAPVAPSAEDMGYTERFLTNPTQDLPRADPEALACIWLQKRPQLNTRPRYLCGQVESAEGALQVLTHGSLFRRRLVARRVELVTQGKSGLTLNSLSSTQQAQGALLAKRLL